MPLNSAQLAALVERARLKAPPVVTPPRPAAPAQRPVQARQATPAPQAPSATRQRPTPATLPRGPKAASTTASVQARPEKAAELEAPPATTAPDESAWFLDKSSWHFHRRFYAIFRRPMERGEYSSLLKQIRSSHAEHLGEDCWRVRVSGGNKTLAVRATRWRLITILPKNWQPSAVPAPEPAEIQA
jgi:hypothetical protein